MIKPEVGRVILFWPGPQTPGICHDFKKPYSGRIAYPWNDRMINVEYIDHNGTHHRTTSVQLLQDNDPKPDGVPFATWMPYQVEQAKVHDRAPKNDFDAPVGGVGGYEKEKPPRLKSAGNPGMEYDPSV